MSKPSRVTLLGLILALLAGSSCAERQLESDEHPPRYRCVSISARVDDGGPYPTRVIDQVTGKDHIMYCECSTTEEFFDPEFRAMIAEIAYDECLRWVREQGYDPDKSTCLEDFEVGEFAGAYGVDEHEAGALPPPCDEVPSGCGVE